MDKIRALQYFIAAAEASSFSGAARRLDVSVTAVARSVTALERSLGVSLFERTVHGLSLTADGSRYLSACEPLLRQLAEADEGLRGPATGPRGTLVCGADPILSQHCIIPALQSFHIRYPEIQIDMRNVDVPSRAAAEAAEVMVVFGWPNHPGLIQRRLAYTRLLICGAPGYWEKHGVPKRIKDLETHAGLLFRDPAGTVIDYWEHERGGVTESVAVKGWLVSTHRDDLLEAAVTGMGVARFTDISIRNQLARGQLVPVLLDWDSKHAPPVSVFYRASQRRLPRVRLFVDFLVELFRTLEAEREPILSVAVAAERPHWYRRRHTRASATPRDKGG